MGAITVRTLEFYSRSEKIDTADGRRFITSIQSQKSAFGAFLWSVTDVKTGEGKGGFATTVDDADRRIGDCIEEEGHGIAQPG